MRFEHIGRIMERVPATNDGAEISRCSTEWSLDYPVVHL
jgi:hypothetical protein